MRRICISLTENGSPAFESFLNLLGERVRLMDFPNYRGGLDNKSESACACVGSEQLWGSAVCVYCQGRRFIIAMKAMVHQTWSRAPAPTPALLLSQLHNSVNEEGRVGVARETAPNTWCIRDIRIHVRTYVRTYGASQCASVLQLFMQSVCVDCTPCHLGLGRLSVLCR